MSKIIDCRIDPGSERNFRKLMKQYMELKGEDIDGAVKNLGQSIGFALMRKTYPLGNTQNAGKKFMQSIGIQVEKGAASVAAQTVAEAHAKARDESGQVTGKLYRVTGAPNYIKGGGPAHEERMKANAGLLKAAWIVAAEKIPGKFGKRKIPSYVKRHIKKTSIGSVKMKGKGLSQTVELTNELSYSEGRLTMVETAIRDGYKSVLFQVKNMIQGSSRLKGRGNTII